MQVPCGIGSDTLQFGAAGRTGTLNLLKREATQASGLQGLTGSSAGLELETSGREKKTNQDLENSGMIQDNYLWPQADSSRWSPWTKVISIYIRSFSIQN